MASTGEVGCIGDNFSEAFFRAWLSTDQDVPKKRILVSIGGLTKKAKLLSPLRKLEEQGWEIMATEGTHDYLSERGVASVFKYKASEKVEPNVTTSISKRDIDLIINIPKNVGINGQTDGYRSPHPPHYKPAACYIFARLPCHLLREKTSREVVARIHRRKRRMKNSLIRFITQFAPKPKNDGEGKRILIISTTGVGDTLWASPALKALKKAKPAAHIALLTTPIGKEIFSQSSDVDAIYTCGTPALFSIFKLFPRLKKEAYDTVLIFHASQRPIFPLAKFLGAKNIISTKHQNKGLDDLITTPVVNKFQHEIERRLDIVNTLVKVESDGLLSFPLTKNEMEKSFAEPIAVIHPGAQKKYKQWSPNHFQTVGKHLAAMGMKVIVTGGKNERALAQTVAMGIPNGANYAGKLSLRALASLMHEAKIVIANDTGPMHIAFALNTPTIALFTPTDPRLCGPYKAKNAHIFTGEITCLPCLQKRCRQPFCMEQISPQAVIAAIDQIGQNGWSV